MRLRRQTCPRGARTCLHRWHGIEENVIERLQQGRDVFDVPFSLDRAVPSRTSARFEWGTWAVVVVERAIEAVKFALLTDPASRWESIRKMRRELVEGLENLGLRVLAAGDETLGSGIVTFATADHKQLVKKLAERRVVVSGRFNHVRVSPHFYNAAEDVDLLLSALREFA